MNRLRRHTAIRCTFRLILVTVSGVISVAASAEDATTRPKQTTGDVEFHAVADLSPPPGAMSGVLIGGAIAQPADYPASFYTTQDEGRCTSTMIGPRVLLTAAHCVADRGKITLTKGGATFSGRCAHAPGYASDFTADWALCKLESGVPSVLFETVNQSPSLPTKGAKILLAGFGCTKVGGGGGNDGFYRIGEATVIAEPTAGNNDLVAKGDAALCFGDSGGAAFVVSTDANQKGRRVLVSVNSRGNIRDTSYLSATSTAAGRAFFADWLARNQAEACGVNLTGTFCRPPP